MGKWAKDVDNEHSKGEGLLCLVTFQAAGVGAHLQVRPPTGMGFVLQASAISFTVRFALSLQPGEFFILQVANP